MSKRIDTTLSEAQWKAIVAAVAYYDVALEDEDNLRGRKVLDRAYRKLAGWVK